MNINTPRIRIGDKIRTHSGIFIKVTKENIKHLQEMLNLGISVAACPPPPRPFGPCTLFKRKG